MSRIIRVVIVFIVLVALAGCRSIPNYPEPEGPLFTGSYADTQPEFHGTLKLITWNIKFSEKIDAAIAELSEVEELQGADVILLQEMDEIGVEAIARSLQYNYVYFPASIHTHHDRNFGNAILSKWPLSDPVKLLLPHENPKNRQVRTATRAVTTIDGQKVLVYSVHTETFWLSEEKRNEQIDSLALDTDKSYEYVIIGGDFNTLTDASIINLEDRLAQVDLVRESAGAEPTFIASGLAFTTDHIFARSMAVVDNGVWPDTKASDHFPVWVTLLGL